MSVTLTIVSIVIMERAMVASLVTSKMPKQVHVNLLVSLAVDFLPVSALVPLAILDLSSMNPRMRVFSVAPTALLAILLDNVKAVKMVIMWMHQENALLVNPIARLALDLALEHVYHVPGGTTWMDQERVVIVILDAELVLDLDHVAPVGIVGSLLTSALPVQTDKSLNQVCVKTVMKRVA